MTTLVFPAYAGMSRQRTDPLPRLRSFPRLRGDEPTRETPMPSRVAFSPPTRG